MIIGRTQQISNLFSYLASQPTSQLTSQVITSPPLFSVHNRAYLPNSLHTKNPHLLIIPPILPAQHILQILAPPHLSPIRAPEIDHHDVEVPQLAQGLQPLGHDLYGPAAPGAVGLILPHHGVRQLRGEDLEAQAAEPGGPEAAERGPLRLHG